MADVLSSDRPRVLISGYGYGGLPPHPPPPPPPAPACDSLLLGRLDQIDLRLRQLEEQQQNRSPSHASSAAPARRGPAAAGGGQHQHTKSLPAALQLQHAGAQAVRGDLMDRLNLLESRIRQLSCELDLDVGVGKAAAAGHLHQLGLGMAMGISASSSVPLVEDPATCWSDSAAAPVAAIDPACAGGVKGKPGAAAAAAAGGGGGWSAVEILQRGARQLHRSKTNNPPTKVKKLKETKCACQNQKEEKRKAERSKTTTSSSSSRRWFMVGC